MDLYEQAAAEAKAAEHWDDLGWITHNWANALGDVGRLDEARVVYRENAETYRKAGRPEVYVLGSELEALRIDVRQGRAVLGEIEARLTRLRGWHKAHQDGDIPPEAPNRGFLIRAQIGALDIAEDAHFALDRWQDCLDDLQGIEDLDRARGESVHEQARTRLNRYSPLLRLGRLREAQAVVEGCLEVFRDAGDMVHQAMVLSALATIWKVRDVPDQAADLERQALALRNRLDDPLDRGISHNNLAHYLERTATGNGRGHPLAALVYALTCSHHQQLQWRLDNLAVVMTEAAQAGRDYDLPPLAELLREPGFEPLARWLAAGGMDVASLQQAIDGLVAEVRERAKSGNS